MDSLYHSQHTPMLRPVLARLAVGPRPSLWDPAPRGGALPLAVGPCPTRFRANTVANTNTTNGFLTNTGKSGSRNPFSNTDKKYDTNPIITSIDRFLRCPSADRTSFSGRESRIVGSPREGAQLVRPRLAVQHGRVHVRLAGDDHADVRVEVDVSGFAAVQPETRGADDRQTQTNYRLTTRPHPGQSALPT